MPGPFEALVLREAPYDHPDAVGLTELAQSYYVDLYGGADTNPLSPAEFTPPRGLFLMGYLGQRPVAMGGWRLADHAPVPARRAAEIRRMFVVEEVRGQGVGRRLLAVLESSARAAGADLMVLETGQPQVAAVALYRAAGYLDVPAFGYWADSPEAVHLAKRLEPVDGPGE
ncbi:MAG: GNAT family N-acetyltransferase [Actinomycetes bacterium]